MARDPTGLERLVFSRTESDTLDLGALFNSSPNAYVIFDPDLLIVGCNAAYLQVVGRKSSKEIVGRHVFEAFPPPSRSSRQLLEASLRKVVETRMRDHIAVIPYDTSMPGQPTRLRYWSATHTPIFGSNGEFRYILQHTVDVSELQKLRELDARSLIAEAGVLARAREVQAANEAIESERQLLRDMFKQAPGFIGILGGPAHIFIVANDAYSRLTGGRRLVGLPVSEALPEVVEQGFIDLLDQVYRTGEPFIGNNVEVVLNQPGLPEPDRRHVDFVYQPILSSDGSVSGIFVQGNDVTEKVRQEQVQALHRRELAHRLKNQLAMTQAIVNQTTRTANDLDQARHKISARLRALANAHDSLISGEIGLTTIDEIVRKTIALLDEAQLGRIAIDGPRIELGSQTALSLSLILHELLTNAMKYGALSTDQGQVGLAWSVGPEGNCAQSFAMSWIESDGPPVSPPDRIGTGTRLIRAGLAGVANSSVVLEHQRTGVVCRIAADFDGMAAIE